MNRSKSLTPLGLINEICRVFIIAAVAGFRNVTAIIGVLVGPWPQKGDNKGAFFKSTHWENIRFSSSMER
jgi:hypothetical protein